MRKIVKFVPNLLRGLRQGLWLSKSRIEAWAGIFLIGTICAGSWLILTAHGLTDAFGHPLGNDFSCFYAAGTLGLHHHATIAWQFIPLHQEMLHLFGRSALYEGWYYPPFSLIIMAALATLSYLPALILWLTGSLFLYLWAMHQLAKEFLPRTSGRHGLFWLLTLSFPLVSLDLGYGQNGLLSAALMALGCAWLRRCPIRAGICFGLMCYKPQLAILIPIALALGGLWQVLLSTGITGFGTLLLPTLVWGDKIWPAFFQGLHTSQAIELKFGGPGYAKNDSLFAALHHLGINMDICWASQVLLACFILALCVRLWRQPYHTALKPAVFLLATLLINPHSMTYDLMLLAPVGLLMIADGLQNSFASWEKSLIAAMWLLPAASVSVTKISHIPVGLILLLLTFLLLFRKASQQEIRQDLCNASEVIHTR